MSKLRRRVFDEGWKLILESHFWEFLEFYFPHILEQIEKEKGYTFLEQELKKIRIRGKGKKRRVDKLVKVYLKTQKEVWLLVHLEIQTYLDQEFAQRMYCYHYRIYDLYQKPVASLAILADMSQDFRPCSLELTALGMKFVHFEFQIAKLLDWAGKEEELKNHKNPFAIVTLASLKASENNFQTRYQWKALLTKMLYEKGYSEKSILELYQFLDGIMVLPEDMEIQYNEEIEAYEKEKTVPYITTAERIGIQKGRMEGRQEGRMEGKQEGMQKALVQVILDILELRFYEIPQAICQKIQNIQDIDRLRSLHREAVLKQSIEEFAEGI